MAERASTILTLLAPPAPRTGGSFFAILAVFLAVGTLSGALSACLAVVVFVDILLRTWRRR